MPKYEEFADAIDIIAIHNGDTRLTRKQSSDLKLVWKTTGDIPGNKKPNFKPPTHDQLKWAEQILGTAWLAFLTVRKVRGGLPSKGSNEDPEDYFKRLKNEAETDDDLWKKGLLSGAIFTPAPWIAGSLALDNGRKIGPGDLPAYNLPNADQVHIEAWFQFKKEPEPKRYVIYPKVIRRPEIGETGSLASETVGNARWIIFDGWVSSRSPRRAIRPPVQEEDPGGAAQPLPGLG